MTTLLTHAYYLGADAKEQAIMRPYPPLGILSIAGWLTQQGHDVDVFDTTFSTPQQFRQYVRTLQPAVVGIYANLMTRRTVVETIGWIRVIAPSATVVIGGPEATHHVDRFLDSGADVIVIGEGEATMADLVEHLERDEELDGVDGIAFRRDGTSVRTAPRELIRPIDQLPFPKREAVDMHAYIDAWKRHHGMSTVSISTMRGCPYTCRWCSRAVYGGSYRRRSPAVVVDEMLDIRRRYAPDALWFVDDVFTISHGWLESFTREVIDRNAVVPYECITRADRMNERVVELLRDSGCFRVWIGAESGSQRVLDAMDRRVEVEQVRTMIGLAKSHGIETGTFIMLGYPGETEDDILETVRHLVGCDPDHFTMTLAYPIAGTPLYDDVRSTITSMPPWETSSDRDIEFARPYTKLYYEHAMRYACNEVKRSKSRGARRAVFTAKAVAARVVMALWR